MTRPVTGRDAVRLQVDGLTVDFPGVRALDAVDFDVRSGEVHALVGENGAGKSTLIKVLGGAQKAFSGVLKLGGEDYRPSHPSHAIEAGIAVIYQEFNLFSDLSVAENIFAGREPMNRLSRGIRFGEMRARSRELFEKLGLPIDPQATVADLKVSEQQLVEIAKALSTDGQVVVMDEPTAALSKEETERLLDVVITLRDEGRAVVYVSHRLDEVFAIADRVTVLRDGKRVATVPIDQTSEDDLVRMMVGRAIESVGSRGTAPPGRTVLSLERVVAGRMVRDIDLSVRAGEIVGIGGVAGAGQAELTQVIFGALAMQRGRMVLDGDDYRPRNPQDALDAGIGFLHEDRKQAGIFPDLSVLQNFSISILPRLRRLLRLISPRAEVGTYRQYSQRLRIKASDSKQLISELSGGNQQKVLLGRALAPGGRLLVLNEPTRGVDVGARAEIHQLVNELTAAGTAVLMVSSDLPELLAMSDRIVVLSRGAVVGNLEGEDRTEENVIACATTGRRIGLPT